MKSPRDLGLVAAAAVVVVAAFHPRDARWGEGVLCSRPAAPEENASDFLV